jgi:hypothetical protein
LAATGAPAASGVFSAGRVRAQGAAGQQMPDVKAPVFNTFGTVVDWRNGVAQRAEIAEGLRTILITPQAHLSILEMEVGYA